MPNAEADRKQKDEWMTVPEAGRALGISPPTVLNRAIQGELVADVVAGRTVIRRDSVEQAIERQRSGSAA